MYEYKTIVVRAGSDMAERMKRVIAREREDGYDHWDTKGQTNGDQHLTFRRRKYRMGVQS